MLDLIRDELQADTVELLVVDVARALADPGLVPALLKLEEAGWDEHPDLLARALRTCRSGRQED